MTTEQNLASEIRDYIGRPQGSEISGLALVDKIKEVVRTEIVPEISLHLPDGYSIDTGRISVNGVLDVTSRTVPTGFSVSLRLLYDGEPIQPYERGNLEEVGDIQRDLESKLDEFAEKYNLVSVKLFPELIFLL